MHEDELWQEYDARGERIMNGGLEKEGKTDNFYGGVAVMIYRWKDGKVEYLFQKRSEFVSSNPNLWDVSAAGHINYGEVVLDTAVREPREEIGAEIEPSRLEFAGEYRSLSYREGNRYIRLYFYDWKEQPSDFHFDDKEVSEVKWVPFDKLVEFWPDLKKPVQEDNIFQPILLNWTKMIQDKYGNH